MIDDLKVRFSASSGKMTRVFKVTKESTKCMGCNGTKINAQ